MSRRFGKSRVPDCECTYNFTCRNCLNAASVSATLRAIADHARHVDTCPKCQEFPTLMCPEGLRLARIAAETGR